MAESNQTTDESFQVQVLGPFALTRNGERIDTDHWQRRAASVFKLLVTVPEHRRLRDEIIDLLWPDAAPDAGMRNLRIVLHRLRQALGGGEPSPVLLDRGWVLLNPAYGWDVDLDRFETLTAGANGDPAPLLQAAGLYHGEALPEDRYDDWAAPVRERVQRTWRTLCLRLAEVYLAHAGYEEAARWFERALAEDPLDEEALRGLLTALDLAGRRADALRRYAEFEALLREQIGAAPSAETSAAAARLRTDAAAEQEPPGTRPWPVGRFLGSLPAGPIVGRREELERLSRMVDEVAGGAGRLVLIGGEAGIGKTRLAQELTVMTRDSGFAVATGRSYRRDRPLPFSPFLDALGTVYGEAPPALRVQVAQRWPELGRLLLGQALSAPIAEIDATEEQRVARGIADFLAALADRAPVAIVLDDLQWADEASVALLQHLAARTRADRVLLAGVYRDLELDRDGPLARTIRELSREGLVERITLGRLGAEETGEMVRATMGPPEPGAGSTASASADDGTFEEYVFRRTKGIPYFIERMLNSLAGRYRLTREIGAGGMGRVFEAVDLRTGARVAAKLMFARTEADPRALRRFQQEGEVLAALSHPNIVRVFGTYLDEHSSAIVMERLEGRSLGQVLDEGTPALPRLRHIAEQVAAALAAAHERGIVHRDIKPDNIMVLAGDRVKVTDFGIARIARPPGAGTTLTSTGVTMGTPLYMAPEQIEGGVVDARSDIYSLGAVLYRGVTGRAPFTADDPLTIAYKHVNEAPIPPRELRPDLPEDWNALILRALAKDPADRFAAAAAMEEALRRLPAREQPQLPAAGPVAPSAAAAPAVLAEQAPPRMKPEPRRRTHPILAGLLAIGTTVVALIILIVLVELTSGSSGSKSPPQAATHVIWGTQGTGPGQFNGPSGAGIGPKDTVWVADKGNHRIQEFTRSGVFLRQTGTQGIGPGQFDTPTDVAVGPHGTIYVADPGNGGIQKLSSSFRPLDTLSIFHPDTNRYSDLTSVAVDGSGNVYATDYSGNLIRTFGVDGGLLRSWGGKGSARGRFNSPDGIAVDPRGYVYVADKFNDRIERFSLDGKYLGTWGQAGSGPGQFNHPADLAVDRAGNVYVADTLNHRIQEFTGGGTFLAQWGTQGSSYLHFNQPSGLAVDSRGNIFVTDYYSNQVQKIVPTRKH
jgi:serine/threonine-protein kinase